MTERTWRWAPVLLAAMLVSIANSSARAAPDPLVCVPAGQFDPPAVAPVPVELFGPGFAQAVYEGPTPPNYDPTKPTILFVQGLHGAAIDWWDETEYHGTNDMLNAAYSAGFKTFFVDLWDASGPAATSIRNGRLLKRQIAFIVDYWGVDSLNIIAHSKGGLDSNAAIVMGAHQHVQNLVTLSSPHWGSPLADLAQSSWFDWLAEILGYNDAGTRFLQTANMALFRSSFDPRPQNNGVHYYTFAGSSWGPLLSALAIGGAYLAAECGDNDGLVCIEGAKHPLARDASGTIDGQHRLVWDGQDFEFELDHDSVRMGNVFLDFFWWWEPDDCYVTVFGSVEPYAGAFWEEGAADDSAPPAPSPRIEAPVVLPGRFIFRGGPLAADQTTRATFPVEGGVTALTLQMLGGDSTTTWALIAPDGQRYLGSAVARRAGAIFRGAWSSTATVDDPTSGMWSVEIHSHIASAYALIVELDSGTAIELSQTGGRIYQPGEAIRFTPTGGKIDRRLSDSFQITVEIRPTEMGLHPPGDEPRLQRWVGSGSENFETPTTPGVYNLSIAVTSLLGDGQMLERDFVTSIAVISDEGTTPVFDGI